MQVSGRTTWVLGALVGLLLAGTLVPIVCLFSMTSPTQLSAQTTVASSQVVDRKGRRLHSVADPHTGLNRPLLLDEIPLALQQAVIATEDAGFYRHPGVDPVGIARAAWQNWRAGEIVSGASTLTQQLARNLFIPAEARWEQSWSRKAREALLALSLTLNYTKDEILALYLNDSYFGHLAYGVEAASHSYFAKPVDQLDLAECALLAGLLQAPSLYDPLTNPEMAKTRQRLVLDLMIDAGYIDRPTADRAFREPLRYASAPSEIQAPHATILALQQAEAILGSAVLASGGWSIQTTLDIDQQRLAEQAVARQLERLNSPRPDSPPHQVDNAAVLVLHAHSGAIRAMVGSPDYANARISGAVNAVLAPRQPGSTCKPLTYAAALERGETLASVMADTECTFSTADGAPYRPINYDYAFHGPVTLRRALACSYNVATVRLYERIGLDALPDIAARMGVPSLSTAGDHGLALTLGSAEVSMLELAGAYAVLANEGRSVSPYLITHIKDAEGKTVYRSVPRPTEQVLDPRIAYLISDVLADAEARLPAFGYNSPLELPFTAAVKTGTTTDWRDNWTVGYTPDTVVVVWTGNADGRPMVEVSGVSGAAPIWNAIMRGLPQAAQPFLRPEGIVERWICPLSGNLAGAACPHRHNELFLAENAPTHVCDQHRTVRLDIRSGEPAATDLPDDLCVLRTVTHWTPETREWAREQGLLTESEHMAASVVDTDSYDQPEPALALLHPADGSRYLLCDDLSHEMQRIEVRAHADTGMDQALIHLLVDGEVAHVWSAPPYHWLLPLEAGQHQLALRLDVAGTSRISEPVSITVIDET